MAMIAVFSVFFFFLRVHSGWASDVVEVLYDPVLKDSSGVDQLNQLYGTYVNALKDNQWDELEVNKTQYDNDGYLKVTSAVPEWILMQLDDLLGSIVETEDNRGLFGKNVFDLNAEYGKPLKDHEFGININFHSIEYLAGLQLEGLNSELETSLESLVTILHDIVLQLFGEDMVLHFFRYVVKFGNSTDNELKWHQDFKYCSSLLDNQPVETIKDNRVATLLIALDDIDSNNGRVQYVKGSNLYEVKHTEVLEKMVPDTVFTVTHVPLDVSDPQIASQITGVNLQRGDLVVHNGYTLHSSAPNRSNQWRRVFAVQFRSKESVRKRGPRNYNQIQH